jgi:hypothetical protein
VLEENYDFFRKFELRRKLTCAELRFHPPQIKVKVAHSDIQNHNFNIHARENILFNVLMYLIYLSIH